MGRPTPTPAQQLMLNTAWLKWTTVPEERKYVIVAAVARILTKQPTVNADDLHLALTQEEYPWDRRAFGAVLRGLEAKGKLAKVAYRPSVRRVCHGRPIMDYKEVKA